MSANPCARCSPPTNSCCISRETRCSSCRKARARSSPNAKPFGMTPPLMGCGTIRASPPSAGLPRPRRIRWERRRNALRRLPPRHILRRAGRSRSRRNRRRQHLQFPARRCPPASKSPSTQQTNTSNRLCAPPRPRRRSGRKAPARRNRRRDKKRSSKLIAMRWAGWSMRCSRTAPSRYVPRPANDAMRRWRPCANMQSAKRTRRRLRPRRPPLRQRRPSSRADFRPTSSKKGARPMRRLPRSKTRTPIRSRHSPPNWRACSKSGKNNLTRAAPRQAPARRSSR